MISRCLSEDDMSKEPMRLGVEKRFISLKVIVVSVREWLALVLLLGDAFDNLEYNDGDDYETDPNGVANVKAGVGLNFIETEEDGYDCYDDNNAAEELVEDFPN